MELLAARCASGGAFHHALPTFLGRDVPCVGGLLEFPRRGDIRIPDQSSDRLVLRNRYGADRKSWPRRDDGSVRNAGCGAGSFLPAVHNSGGPLGLTVRRRLVSGL